MLTTKDIVKVALIDGSSQHIKAPIDRWIDSKTVS
jgi:hypothetical protein